LTARARCIGIGGCRGCASFAPQDYATARRAASKAWPTEHRERARCDSTRIMAAAWDRGTAVIAPARQQHRPRDGRGIATISARSGGVAATRSSTRHTQNARSSSCALTADHHRRGAGRLARLRSRPARALLSGPRARASSTLSREGYYPTSSVKLGEAPRRFGEERRSSSTSPWRMRLTPSRPTMLGKTE